MKITQEDYYDGAKDKIKRLGLSGLFLEVKRIILDTEILLLEKHALAAKVSISVMQSATEVKLTETVPNNAK